MKIKFSKQDHQYQCGLYRGKGGVSSLVAARTGNFWYAILVFFSFKNWKTSLGISWMELFGGYINIGPITIYGANAMNWAVNIRTKRWGAICFTLPVLARWRKGRHDGKWHYNWYFYLSYNCTPWGSTFYRGSDKSEVIRAQIRKLNFGHGTAPEYKKLRALNIKFDSLSITEYDIERFHD